MLADTGMGKVDIDFTSFTAAISSSSPRRFGAYLHPQSSSRACEGNDIMIVLEEAESVLMHNIGVNEDSAMQTEVRTLRVRPFHVQAAAVFALRLRRPPNLILSKM